MQQTAERASGTSWWIWALAAPQLLIVAAYGYAVVGYLTTDAAYFPEQAPPSWSWPAVIAVGIGFVPAVLCLILALPLLASADVRAEERHWRLLAVASAASIGMLLIMATPAGWALFDWYVS